MTIGHKNWINPSFRFPLFLLFLPSISVVLRRWLIWDNLSLWRLLILRLLLILNCHNIRVGIIWHRNHRCLELRVDICCHNNFLFFFLLSKTTLWLLGHQSLIASASNISKLDPTFYSFSNHKYISKIGR